MRVAAADPDLLRSLEPQLARRLRQVLVSDLIRIEPDAPLDVRQVPPDTLGLLVLDGVLKRRVSLGARSSIELLGCGDVVRPWEEEPASEFLPWGVTWQAMAPVRLAVLDREFSVIAARHPSILSELAARFVERSHALADRLAIARIPRLDARLLALLWHLADRWGHRHDRRVTIPLWLCHATLAELACSPRPPVSLALRNLTAAGRIARSADGGWDLFDTPATEAVLRAVGARRISLTIPSTAS